jgi:hypothetical protein
MKEGPASKVEAGWIAGKHAGVPEFGSCTRNSVRVSGRFYIVAGAAEQGLSHGGTRSL